MRRPARSVPQCPDPWLARLDEGADVAGELGPVLVAHVHHVAGVIIFEMDAIAGNAGPRQRIFGAKKGVAKS